MAARLHRENDIAYDGVGKHSTALAVTKNAKFLPDAHMVKQSC